MEMFNRAARIAIVEGDHVVLDVGAYNGVAGLAFRFNVRQKLTRIPDTATVEINNLSPASRAAVAQRSIVVTLQGPLRYLQVFAGYGASAPGLFNGGIMRAYNKRNGADWVTEIDASVGMGQALGNVLSQSWGNTPPKTILDGMFAAVGLGQPTYSKGALAVLQGKPRMDAVAAGSAYEAVAKLLASFNLPWTVGVNGVSVTTPHEPISAEEKDVVKVSVDSGLLGTPEINDLGITFTTLLDYRIMPGVLCEVDSDTLRESLKGLTNRFTAWVVTHRGDTMGNDWRTEVQGFFYPFPALAHVGGVEAPAALQPEE
jgi:hypothetical protein